MMKDKLMVFMVMFIASLISSFFFTSAIAGIYELNAREAAVCFMFIAVGILLLLAIINSIIGRIHKIMMDKQKL